ncbi:NAD(P)-dependent oxidoreductase [bacterium]|nr:NAD(P)-dependent oxidoreductase [bacterium]
MRILLAGASGAIGRQVIPLLLDAGHSVTGMCRSDEGMAIISRLGGGARRCDALDAQQVRHLVEIVRPEAIICELTDLPAEMNPANLNKAYSANNKVRREGTLNLLEAARNFAVRRFVTQSAAFWYSPLPPGPKDESAPMYTNAPEPIGSSAEVMTEVEGAVTSCSELEGIALRYGSFYGPGTWFDRSGQIGRLLKRGMYPIFGKGEGVTSFIHVEDAAGATIAALDRGRAGEAYNAVDDEPARQADWLPVLADALGAPRPRSMPVAMVRLTLGRATTDLLTTGPGALNTKIKTELGWQPKYSSWREGFRSL